MCAKVCGAVALAFASCHAAPLKGSLLAKRSGGAEPKNEPCYVHDAACDGYPVCCVTKGTCTTQHSGTISSNTAYYEGGCQSLDSSTKEWEDAECQQQGECLIQHMEVCKGGKTKPGFLTELDVPTLARFMARSCLEDCPNANYGHGSYGSGATTADPGNDTTTTHTQTTTTTSITQVTGSMQLSLSDASAVTDHAKLELMLGRAVAALAGYGSDHSFTTIILPGALTSPLTVNYRLDVSNVEGITATQAKANIAAHTSTQINEAIAMRVGSCSFALEQHQDVETPSGTVSRCAGATVAMVLAIASAAA